MMSLMMMSGEDDLNSFWLANALVLLQNSAGPADVANGSSSALAFSSSPSSSSSLLDRGPSADVVPMLTAAT